MLHHAATRLQGEMGSQSSKLEADSAPRTALERAYSSGDPRAYRDIEASIQREKTGGLPAPHEAIQSPLPGPNSTQSLSPNMNYGYQNGYPGYGGVNGQRSHQMPPQGMFVSGPSMPRPDRMLSIQGFHFKPSPFYQVIGRIGQVHTCEGKSTQVPPRIFWLLTASAVMQNHRNCTNIQIKAQDNPLLARCVTEKDMRVFVFCAAANQGPQDIAFPHQSELKVNGGDVKANLRGLKNKPGSTRPVDITDLLRLKIPNYANNIEFTYALTQKAGNQASQDNVQVRRTRLRPALTYSRVKVATLCANSFFWSTFRDSTLLLMSARRLLWTASYEPSLARGSQKPPSCTNVSTVS